MSCVSFGNDESANYSCTRGEWKAIKEISDQFLLVFYEVICLLQ